MSKFSDDVDSAVMCKLAGAFKEMVTEAQDQIINAKKSAYDRAVQDPVTGQWRLIDPIGYARIYEEQPTVKNWLRYQYEHRKVMEEALQRQILATEVIHHLDGNRSNNALENLKLTADHIAHIRAEHPDWRRGLTGRE
jgi:hypothetical protein